MDSVATKGMRAQASWLKKQRGSMAERSGYVAIALLIVIVTLINVDWMKRDTRPFYNGDASGYLSLTFQFIDTVESQDGTPLWQSVNRLSRGGRPPLYQLITVPFIWLFGRSMDAGLGINLFFYAILLLSTYSIGKLAKNSMAGLLAAFVVAAYPPVIHLSRLYLPHFAAIACAALTVWLLLALVRTRSARVAWLLGASLAFGALISHYYIYSVLVPTTVVGTYTLLFQTAPHRPPSMRETPRWLWFKLREPFVLGGLLPAALIAVGSVAAWYLLSGGREIFGYYQLIQETETGWHQVGFTDVSPSFWWYARTAPGAISHVFTALLAAGLVIGLVKRQVYIRILVIAFVGTYCLISLALGQAWYEFAGVLPVAAVLSVAWIVDIRHKPISIAVAVVCAGAAAFTFSFVTWGVQPWNQPIASVLGAPLTSATCSDLFSLAFCPNPPQDENWAEQVNYVLDTIANESECENRQCYLVVISYDRSFNHATFEYYLAQNFPGSLMTVVGPDTGWWRVIYNLPGLLESDYLLYGPVAGEHNDRFFGSPPAAFADSHQEIASLPLPGGLMASLIKRTSPLTIEEAQASIAALDIPEEEKSLQYELLARLNAQNGETGRALALYEQALQTAPYAELEQAKLLIEMAELYDELGDERQAREAYAQAIALDPSYTTASIRLAMIELQAGRPEAAWQVLQSALDSRPGNPAGLHVQLGLVYQEVGQIEDAMIEYRKAIKVDPTSAWAHTMLGNAHRETGQIDTAIAEYQEALRLDPDYLAAYISLGNAYGLLGRTGEALAAYRQAVQAAPDSAWPHTILGNAYRDQDQIDLALAEYQEAVRVEPDYVPAYVAIGKVYESRAQVGEALSQYQRALEVDPSDLSAYVSLGALYQGQGDSDMAISVYTEALEANPGSETLAMALSRLFLEQDKVHEAITEFSRLIERYPESLGGYLGLAAAYRAQGLNTAEQVERAIGACQQALQVDPRSTQALKMLGDTHMDLQDWEQAILHYQQLVEIDPAAALNHSSLGRAYLGKGDVEAAIAAFQEALRRAPNEAWPRRYLGQAYLDAGEVEAAVATSQEAVRLAPDEAWPQRLLGEAYRESGDLDGAMAGFREAVRLDPSEPGGHRLLAEVYREKGLLNEAVAEYQEAVKLKPDSPWYHLYLGQAYEEMGLLEAAVSEYRLALDLNPDHLPTMQALSRVEEFLGTRGE